MKRLLCFLGCFLSFCATSTLAQFNIVSRTDTDPGFSYTPSPDDWRDINMYQIFTDRFFDGDTGNNFARMSTEGNPWYNQHNSSAENDRHLFQGGDWAGVKAKLDYLQGMGVNCIWISGVQLNEQGFDKRFTPYHAYHPSDFYQVEPMFGTFDELKDLIDTAHSKGIYVIIDVVVNHMADLLKYTDCNCNYEGYCENNCGSLDYWNNFVQFGAPFNSPSHFHNNGNISGSDWDTYPRYIKGSFLGTEDLRTEDPYVQNELNNIFKHLIDATDCDGFRVDAIKHMEYDFIKQWADNMRQHAAFRGKNNFLLFGEYFSYDNNIQASYCKDDNYSFNSTLWFPMQATIWNVFAREQGTQQLGDQMNSLNIYGEAKDKVVAFIDNHDVDRIALEAGSSWESKLHSALTFVYLATPVPCLFYGTEHGFNQGNRRNGSPVLGQADFQRECMWDFGYQWGNANGDKFYASNFYNHIKRLNELRTQFECLRRGNFQQRWAEGGAGIYAFTKSTADQDALVIFNTAWNNKSATPAVNKPDGTVYENMLNPGETATVSGGTLNISVNGKESKVFIAGSGNASVETSCTIDTLSISYTPNAGVLENPVGNIRVLISHDGGQNPIDVAMTQNGSEWNYDYSLATASNEVTFSFRDEDTPPTTDDNDGQNWVVDVEFCGQLDVDLAWIGNAYQSPTDGDVDVGEDLWVNIESYPQDAVADGEVVYTIDGGTTWTNKPLSFNGTVGNNDTWHANLGQFPGNTAIRYAIRVTGRNGDFWDNNGGGDYNTSVNPGPTTISWIGDTYHWPENGFIEIDSELWININSEPVGAGVSGEVVYSSDGGATWNTVALAHNGTANNKDQWNANLGTFPALSTVRYAVKVTDGDGTDHWDNNGGENFLAEVNEAFSSIRWFGNARSAGGPIPQLGIHSDMSTLQPVLELGGLLTNGIYSIYMSTNMSDWVRTQEVPGVSTASDLPIDIGEQNRAFFRIVPDYIPGTQVFEDEDMTISIETWPIGGALGANIVYSWDGGVTWNVKSMRYAGTQGNNDLWTVNLGVFPLGTVVQYAIEVVDDESNSHWDNNSGADFNSQVMDPDQTDFDPPTTSYSPNGLTVAAPTLDVTLSAVDAVDPNPVIYYTTDGSEPTTSSSTYSGAITVTDAGAGVDALIKFMARDAAGNQSDTTTLEVRVNQSFNFGPDKPYSTNPSLGQAVPNGGITADGVNNGEWDDSKLIAIDMAHDDPRTLGSNYTMHEAPIDLTHLWGAWDDNNLYLAWQYVDVTDVLDPANAGGAGSGKINSNDGILQWIVLDTKTGGATIDVWGKNDGEPYWTGSDVPDFQIYMAGSLWQGYISREVGGVFPVDDGGVNYFPAAGAGISYGTGDSFEGSTLWGNDDADNRFDGNAPTRDFLTQGHDTGRDSFYEIAIPLSFLQITRAQLEANGLGVLIGAGSASAMDSIPHDETTLDSPGVEVWNSSFEWGDVDSFTTPFARVAAPK